MAWSALRGRQRGRSSNADHAMHQRSWEGHGLLTGSHAWGPRRWSFFRNLRTGDDTSPHLVATRPMDPAGADLDVVRCSYGRRGVASASRRANCWLRSVRGSLIDPIHARSGRLDCKRAGDAGGGLEAGSSSSTRGMDEPLTVRGRGQLAQGRHRASVMVRKSC